MTIKPPASTTTRTSLFQASTTHFTHLSLRPSFYFQIYCVFSSTTHPTYQYRSMTLFSFIVSFSEHISQMICVLGALPGAKIVVEKGFFSIIETKQWWKRGLLYNRDTHQPNEAQMYFFTWLLAAISWLWSHP